LENLKRRDFLETSTKWVDNIGMDLGEAWWEGVDWIHLAQGRDQLQALVNMVLNLWVS
jgi:hypothetical protein